MRSYPPDWPAIRRAVLLRAGGLEDDPRKEAACERCGIKNYTVQFNQGEIVAYYPSYSDARQACTDWRKRMAGKFTVVVLTIAHIHDPNPMNCSMDNLQALCQRCHNNLDAALRRKHARETRRKQIVCAGQMILDV